MTNKRKTFLVLNIFLVLLWCGFIFYLSGETAPQSRSQSKPLAEGIVKKVEEIQKKHSPPPVLKKKIDKFENSLRDAAHSGCYFVLSLLLINLLYLLKMKKLKAIFLTIIISMLYALSDEIHQLFVPGRAFQLIDMALDFVGVVLAISIYLLLFNMILKKKKETHE